MNTGQTLRSEKPVDILEAFAEALHCSLADLLTDQPPTTVPRTITLLSPPAVAAPRRDALPATAWMPRPTITEFQTLIARKKAGAFRPGDAQRLADIMRYWPCWDMTDEEWDAWDAVKKGRV